MSSINRSSPFSNINCSAFPGHHKRCTDCGRCVFAIVSFSPLREFDCCKSATVRRRARVFLNGNRVRRAPSPVNRVPDHSWWNNVSIAHDAALRKSFHNSLPSRLTNSFAAISCPTPRTWSHCDRQRGLIFDNTVGENKRISLVVLMRLLAVREPCVIRYPGQST